MFGFLPREIYIGPLTLHLFGVTVVIGVLAGLAVSIKLAKERSIKPELIMDFLIYAGLFGVVLARVIYIAQNTGYYFANPYKVFALWEGGLSFHGALLGGLLSGIWYAQKTGLGFWRLADTLAPGLALGEAVGRIGCDLYGKEVITKGLYPLLINGVRYHNIPLYTSLASFVIFIILWLLRGRIAQDRRGGLCRGGLSQGSLFLIFLILYSIARFILEFFRGGLMLGPIISGQLLSIILIVTGVFLLMKGNRRPDVLYGKNYSK